MKTAHCYATPPLVTILLGLTILMGWEVYQNCPLEQPLSDPSSSSSSIQTCLCMNAVSQASLGEQLYVWTLSYDMIKGCHPSSSQAITENQNKLGKLFSFASL